MDVESPENFILDVLQRASSQNPDILKPAVEKLKEWETQPGFYNTLLNVFCNHNVDVNVRWIAVLYLKNGIDKYWRKKAPGAILEEEKECIRQGLLSNFNEPVSAIAIQRAVLVSKIARHDFPKEWSQLFPILVQAVESPDNLIQHRALLTLHHVIKAVSTKRLPGDKKNFQELTNKIYPFTLNLWHNYTENFIRDIVQDCSGEIISVNLEKALLLLRILRKMTINGFSQPHTNPNCMSFLNVIFEKAKVVLECRKQLKGKGLGVLESCEKFIIHLTKVLLSLLDVYPFSFVDLIQPSLEFAVYYLFTNDGVQFLFERFVIQCFNLIKNILLCVEYRAAKNPELTKHPATMKAYQTTQAFFQPDVLNEICRKLVTHYFILTQDELLVWDQDPEAFSNDEAGDSWKYSLRPSMETVFVTLFRKFKEVLTPIMLELISETNVLIPPEDMQGILKKDAVYNAVGLCAFDLYDEVDFDYWFTNTLLKEVIIKHNNYRVIRRRVSAMLGHWTSVKLSQELRPTLYECIINLLGPEENLAVRLTACETLKHAIDDFDFNFEQFKDYLFTTFDLLYKLLKETSECETKMHVLNAMTLMLERMGHSLIPYYDALLQYLPHLWEESQDHNMLRCCIVASLVQIVKALEGVKPELYPFLLPIIQLGTDSNGEAIVYLLEDCLELWLIVLEYTATITPELMQLFHNIKPLLEKSTENLSVCLLICTTQLLINPELFLSTFGLELVSLCDGMVSDLKNEGIILIMRLIETIIKSNPAIGSETVTPILPRILEQICAADSYPLIMSSYLAITSRVLLSNHDVFRRGLAMLAQKHEKTEEIVLGTILDVWLIKMPMVSQREYTKLLAMALTNLLTTQSRPVFERFSKIMLHITEALNDITTKWEGGQMVDTLVLSDGQSPPSSFNDNDDRSRFYETDHDQRKKQLVLSDPVHTVILKDYLQSQLSELKNQIGITHYQQLCQSLDANTVSQLEEFISI
ncbi:unnamed protein product [Brassicogethes aeneus]|uniref:Importin N-terminal domain-containing protein n=1 Tax=Brassicogethes aeneus TaxID=1431903 RepID=A0A9P0BCM8_BRAAE|nr:unnamed protein product [Brassicogethes aeneus]